MNKAQQQSGFALTDALIAAAIAAGVAITTAQSIAMASRSMHIANERSAALDDAELILARLDGGLRNDALLTGLQGWTLETESFSPYDNPSTQRSQTFQRLIIRNAARELTIERLLWIGPQE